MSEILLSNYKQNHPKPDQKDVEVPITLVHVGLSRIPRQITHLKDLGNCLCLFLQDMHDVVKLISIVFAQSCQN